MMGIESSLFSVANIADQQWCEYGGWLWKTLVAAGWKLTCEIDRGRYVCLVRPAAKHLRLRDWETQSMTYMQWVMRLPEVGADLIAKAKRVEALRAEAEALEDEVCQAVNRQWADEVAQAKGQPLPGWRAVGRFRA